MNGGMWHVRGKTRGTYRVLVGKPETNSPLGRLKRSWEDNIKTHLKKKSFWEVVYWIILAQDTDKLLVVVKTVMNFRAP
jgi:hypothetical protein